MPHDFLPPLELPNHSENPIAVSSPKQKIWSKSINFYVVISLFALSTNRKTYFCIINQPR